MERSTEKTKKPIDKKMSLLSRIEELEYKYEHIEKRLSEDTVLTTNTNIMDNDQMKYLDNKFNELKSCIITAIAVNGIKNEQIEKMMTEIEKYFKTPYSDLLCLEDH